MTAAEYAAQWLSEYIERDMDVDHVTQRRVLSRLSTQEKRPEERVLGAPSNNIASDAPTSAAQ